MSIIERYILRRIAIVAVAALVLTTAMALTTQVMNRVDFLTSSGQTIQAMGWLSLLLIPPMVVIAMPFALLVGVLSTMRGMNQNSELAVLEASGASIAGRARPALLLAGVATAIVFVLSVWVEPASSRQIRELITKAAGDLLSAAIQSGGFKQIEDGLVIQIAEKRAGGEFGGIFVSDERDPQSHITYVAESGALITEQGRTLMLVRNGEIQRRNTVDNSITFIRFDLYSLDASTFSAPKSAAFGPKQQPTSYLFNPDPDDPVFQSVPHMFKAEMHKRFSEPLYPLMMVLIALFYTVNARSNRRETLTAVLLASSICFGVRAAGFATVSAAGDNMAATVLAYGLPGFCIVLFSALLWRGRGADFWIGLAEKAADWVGTRNNSFLSAARGLVTRKKPA
jgi:lipopolysaccharide export system permease protein